MKLTIDFAPDVPKDAENNIAWFLFRAVKTLGRVRVLQTSVPGFDASKKLRDEDHIVYQFNYEDRSDDLLVTVTVEKADD